MKIKKQLKINHIIYLFLLKESKSTEKNFVDSLVHIYRLIRLNTDWKIDKSFVAYDFKIVDTEHKSILDSLSFFGMIYSDYSLTPTGATYLHEQLQENLELENVLSTFKKDYSDKIGYENTCLSSNSPTSANCGLCKSLSCNKTTKLKDVFTQYLRVPNYQKSFSKA